MDRRLRWGNCLLFALGRWATRGGYLVVRKSRHGWWPHVIWSQDLKTFEHFGPPVPRQNMLFPPPVFLGLVHTFTCEQGDR